jgi:hypothetical protein
MAERQTIKTQRLKHVFIDVVDFTSDDRDVEDMHAIIVAMNSIVKVSLRELQIERHAIVIPTGDGMCIGIKKQEPYDIHLKLALLIRTKVNTHTASTGEIGQQFKLLIRPS